MRKRKRERMFINKIFVLYLKLSKQNNEKAFKKRKIIQDKNKKKLI